MAFHGEFAPKEKITNNNEIRQEKVRKEQGDDIFEMIYDATGPDINSGGVDPSEPTSEFSKLLEDAAQQLYPGCEKFSKL